MSRRSPRYQMDSGQLLFRSFLLTLLCVSCGRDQQIAAPLKNEVVAFLTLSPRGEESVRHIPASSFTMGSDTGEEDERPEHSVRVSGFFLHQMEVTVDAYRDCVHDGTCREAAVGAECNGGKVRRRGAPGAGQGS